MYQLHIQSKFQIGSTNSSQGIISVTLYNIGHNTTSGPTDFKMITKTEVLRLG